MKANQVFQGLPTTIFEVMSGLARQHGAVNLGQGFPEGMEPPELIQAAARALEEGSNQYPPMMGLPVLREAVARHERRFYGLDIDADGVLVTSGATEALASCLLGLIEPGDEVVLIEPLYDSYLPMVRRAGGVPRLVKAKPPRWAPDPEELAAAFGARTKLLVLNSPTNPTGKVYDRQELAVIAGMLEAHDAYAVCDEVYEHLVYDGRAHVPLMTLPGMRRRCLRIGSAGKIFSLTGWKVGFIVGDPALLAPVAKAHQFLTFTTPPNLQAAVALGLDLPDSYFTGLRDGMQARRDRLAGGLRDIGFTVSDCAGTYFLVADLRPLGIEENDADFCRRLVAEAKVAAVPLSAFYPADPPRHLIRFSFAKTEAMLEEALSLLRRHFGTRPPSS